MPAMASDQPSVLLAIKHRGWLMPGTDDTRYRCKIQTEAPIAAAPIHMFGPSDARLVRGGAVQLLQGQLIMQPPSRM